MLRIVKILLLNVAVLYINKTVFAEQIFILANPKPFESIQEAANAEKQVNWWDGDLSDDRACTECFAAVELANFLKAVTKYDIVLQSAEKLPSNGHVFIVGSNKSNSLISFYNLSQATLLKTDDSFLMYADNKDGRIITIIQGKYRTGTLYGVYSYLELLGFRFYGLGDKQNPRAGKQIPSAVLIQRVEFPESNSSLPKISRIKQDILYDVPSHGTVYPPQDKTVELPSSLKIIKNPSFLTRGFWAWENYHGNPEFFLWMARNKMNVWTAADENINMMKKLGFHLTGSGHEIFDFYLNPNSEYPYNHKKFTYDDNKPKDPYPVSKQYKSDINNDGKLSYFEAHPEWFGMVGGIRSDIVKEGHGNNYCTSNADATNELIKNLIQSLIDGQYRYMDIVAFWPLDNGKWCECENCRKQGNPTDRFFILVDTTLKSIQKARKQGRLNRPVHISSCAYQETLAAPTHPLPKNFDYSNHSLNYFPIMRCYAHFFCDNNCAEINKYCLDYFEKLQRSPFFKGSFFVTEYYNVSSLHSLPAVYTKIMATDIPWYYDKGVRHFSYMHTPTRLWGTWTLNQCLLANLLWNHKTDVTSFLDEYYEKYYPTTTKSTRNFYENLEKAFANIKAWKHYVGYDGIISYADQYKLWERLASETAPLFPKDHLHYESYSPKTNDGPDFEDMMDFLRLARKDIDESLLYCNDETEKIRLLEDERRFRYGELMADFYYHLVRTAIFHRRSDRALAACEFTKVKDIAQQLQTITDIVLVSSSHGNKENGFVAAGAERAYNFYDKIYADPQFRKTK